MPGALRATSSWATRAENLRSADLARAEAIAIPVTLVLLLFVFGGTIAAGMPLLVGAGSIEGSLFVLCRPDAEGTSVPMQRLHSMSGQPGMWVQR